MKKLVYLIIPSMLSFSSGVSALECEVEYIAKKNEKTSRWFGKIKKSNIKSGKEKGKGKTRDNCRDNALKEVLKSGWKVTSEKIVIK